MIDILQLRTLIIRPVLKYIDMWSDVAEDLVTGTAIQESMATYLANNGKNPTLGLFQMEPYVHDDLWKNDIAYRLTISNKLHRLTMRISEKHPNGLNQIPAEEMIGNIFYATAMCMLQYNRAPAPLPKQDVNALASFWKRYYAPYRSGTIDEFVYNYNKYNRRDT